MLDIRFDLNACPPTPLHAARVPPQVNKS
ncbi:hypothetical protein FRIGORI9N_460025 [Frigoribacterium sp. 9N]|nr:hypothetical protein FRIGORI9N_460025 [Frigoribacterium sp. 9N]